MYAKVIVDISHEKLDKGFVEGEIKPPSIISVYSSLNSPSYSGIIPASVPGIASVASSV